MTKERTKENDAIMTPIDEAPPMRDVFLVTVSDGTLFHCEPRYIGDRHDPISYRWSIIRRATSGQDTIYVGPTVQADRSPRAVQTVIEDWWAMKKALGQDGVTAKTLHDRLSREGD